MTREDYYAECLSSAAEECELTMTPEQHKHLAKAVESAAENIGMAFYSPPASDRYSDIERDWKAKYQRLEREFEEYRGDAETAVKQALRQHHDARVSIGKHGEVRKHDGRSDRIP